MKEKSEQGSSLLASRGPHEMPCVSPHFCQGKVAVQEWSYIPVGGALPDTRQPTTGFGAAASMIHPATGTGSRCLETDTGTRLLGNGDTCMDPVESCDLTPDLSFSTAY